MPLSSAAAAAAAATATATATTTTTTTTGFVQRPSISGNHSELGQVA